jgi:hypothetical protein
MKVRSLILVFFLLTAAAVLVSAGAAVAQETTTGAISGRVTDAQGLPVPGVTVTVTSGQGSRAFVTDQDGRYLASFLTPGVYTVRTELQGFKPIQQKNVVVPLGQQIALNLSMQVGGLSETVDVTAATPVIDTTNTQVQTNIESAELTRLPVLRRFSDALYIAPGVSSGGDVGAANPSVSGGSGLENQYVVDGVNITNQGYGALGSYSIIFGSLGNGTPFDFVKELQVNEAGYEAENAASTGGVVNVITKSGTNALRGSGFGYLSPSQLQNTFTQVNTTNGTINTSGTRTGDAGLEIGGPVMKDKLFFFGAFDPSLERTSRTAPVGFPLASLGALNRDRHIYNYAAKGTYQLNANHRIDASFFGDPARGLNGPQRGDALLSTDTSEFSSLKYGGHNQTVRYNGVLGPHFLLEASWARAKNDTTEIPSVNTWSVTDTTVTPNVFSGGVGFYETHNLGIDNQLSAKGTNVFEALGSHELRYGVSYQLITYNNVFNRTGPTFTLPNGQQSVTGAEISILPDPTYGQIYRVVRANTTDTHNTKQDYWSLFIQDSYKLGSHLTIQPGIRYEQQKLIGNLTSYTFSGNWAPRVGAVYDPFGQGKFKIYGNFGLYYSIVPNDLAARSLSADAGITRADYFDASLTQPVPTGVLAAGSHTHFITSGESAAPFAPGTGTSKYDEEVGGFEWEAFPGWNLGVRYIRRSIDRILEDTSNAAMVLYFTRPDLVSSTEYFIANPTTGFPSTLLNQGSFEAPIHHYNAVEVTAARRFANNWAVQASYRWSRLDGTYEGFFRNDNGQSDPAISSLYDFPSNDPSYTQIGGPQFGFLGDIRYQGALGSGPLPNDRTHQIKAYGNYQFNFGLNLGLGVNMGSGRPLTAFAANPVYDSPGEIPMTPRGAGMQTTTNGFLKRAPFQYDTDLHADYRFNLGGNRHLVVLADVFNLLNTQRPTNFDFFYETSFQALNPDFGAPEFLHVSTYQPPRQMRIGARFEF